LKNWDLKKFIEKEAIFGLNILMEEELLFLFMEMRV
jgi:hypothetical protein